MGNNIYFDELIVSYLSKNLNPEEEAFVLDWINFSEQNKQYFEELKSTWNFLSVNQIVKGIDVDVEWDQFKQVISTKEKELCTPKGVENEAIEKVRPDIHTRLYKLFISTAVAASMIVAIALVWRLFNENSTGEKPLAFNVNAEILSTVPFVKHNINSTDETKKLLLADGSEVLLYAKSEISYSEPFIGNKRDITLVGKAYFKVAKDKLKPFTVFSGDISTTALGTQFTITALPNEKHIRVRLHEGKVVIKAIKGVGAYRMNDVYLRPGQELVYNVFKGTSTIRPFWIENRLNKKDLKKEELLNDDPAVPTLRKRSWFMFNNQPLNEVFDALATMYNVKINYSKKEINKTYIIGTFNKSDSLENILNQIALINNLSLIKDTNSYTIKKQVLKQKN